MGVDVMPVTRQLSALPSLVLGDWATAPDAELGEVFTRRWVVDFILDLVGYTPDRDLASLTIVEPSCGSGAFVLPIIERLIESCLRHKRSAVDATVAVRAFDLLEVNVALARKAVVALLAEHAIATDEAEQLAAGWIATGDFLLTEHDGVSADFVVGNPPYIRLENVPAAVTEAYRRACPTMRGRSDVYVGFFEVGLDLLKPDGALAFVCADRWMHNEYGAALRDFVTRRYNVDAIITMHDVDAFETEVSAYPAITVIRDGAPQPTHIVEATRNFTANDTNRIAAWVHGKTRTPTATKSFRASRLERWHRGPGLWPSGGPAQLSLLAKLESQFAPLEDSATRTRVGIGVATGCDEVYITTRIDVVEPDRLMPLLRASDLTDGTAEWSGSYLINPWANRSLVDLADYPLLGDYLNAHRKRLQQRHTAQKNLSRWYRTIDVVDAELQQRPKLLLPDLKAAAHPVLDSGTTYPHHNLYYVVSDAWDLEVLGGILLSDIANLFVGAYCVKMRGGCYRFQAQYLRQIRVPSPDSIAPEVARSLAAAFRSRDQDAATEAVAHAYGVDLADIRRARK